MKKILLVCMLVFALAIPDMTEARSFSASKSTDPSFTTKSTSNVIQTRSRSSRGSYNSGYRSPSRSSGSYNSGYRSPSRSVTRGSTYNRATLPRRSGTGSFFSHAAAFGAGAFLTHMLHPFGGMYYGASHGFSFFGILLDILLIVVVFKLFRRLFSRNRRYY
ncbi:hypothetical protein [Peribacillus deserti]|uniref:Uncharacterized protein n=1 Tax=Peribacillus deserti TaxID=673318 RepID=A0A2N5M0D1_9BACI|nr:hypothetical protein [Peribacillus deserti]PLT27819.1 hypothetical protein CUU66_21925 [Peribacillus deserti]